MNPPVLTSRWVSLPDGEAPRGSRTGPVEAKQQHLLALRAKQRFLIIWRALVGASVVALIYQSVVFLDIVDPDLLPSVHRILLAAAELSLTPDFLGAVANTMLAVGIGVLISLFVGVLAGMALGVSNLGYRMARGPIDMMRSIPSVAMIPLLVLTLGQGLEMKIFVSAYVSLWPLLFNTMYGVRSVDPLAKDAARSMGLSEPQVWLKVTLPSTSPSVMTGLRIALPLALTVAISAEIAIGSRDGIGGYILRASYLGFDAAVVYGAVVLAGVVGFTLNALTATVSDRLMRWDGRR